MALQQRQSTEMSTGNGMVHGQVKPRTDLVIRKMQRGLVMVVIDIGVFPLLCFERSSVVKRS